MKDKNMPVFIKIDEYKDIREIIDLLKLKIEQAQKTLEKVSELKQKEDSELASWQSGLAEIEKRLRDIDNNLYEPEGF